MPSLPEVRAARLVALAVAVTASVAVVGCGSGPTGGDVGAVHTPLVGGAVDDTTTGVLALAISLSGRFEVGCSASLLAPNLVLTARHCVAPTAAEASMSVDCTTATFDAPVAASDFLVSPSTVAPAKPDATFFRGAEIRVPERTDLCGNDVALIMLERGVPSSLATPLVPRIDVQATAAELFSAEGYGYSDPDTMTGDGTRRRLDGQSVECAGTGCSSNPDKSALRDAEWLSLDDCLCPGDSGGAALDARGRVFGVASRAGTKCSAAIYSDVSSFRDLIISTALDAASSGGYDAPAWTSGSSTLGTPCEGSCPDELVCYAETNHPPGICVPRCSSGKDCPSGYACSSSLEACVPSAHSSDSDGCAIGGWPARSSPCSALVATAVALALARRCRALKSRKGERFAS